MKNLNYFIFTSLLILLTSCQKDKSQNNTNKVVGLEDKISKRNLSYIANTLSPSQSNPNIYTGSYGGFSLTVSGLTYDQVDYPNNVNGVPAQGTVSTSNGSVTQSYIKNEASTVVLSTPVVSFNSQLGTDLENYDDALLTWQQNGSDPASMPDYQNYIKGAYVISGSKITTTTLKLIRVTNGNSSLYAVADPNYPQPKPIVGTKPSNPTAFPNSCSVAVGNIQYDLWMSNGNITSVADAYYLAPKSGNLDVSNWMISGTYNNVNKNAQTCNATFNIYQPGVGNIVTYSGTAYLGF